jgi:histidine triad (HIT) family protein
MSDCLFCKIAAGDIPADKVYEDDELIAFRDISPQAPTHVLVIPRRHVASLDGAEDGDGALLGRLHKRSRKDCPAGENTRVQSGPSGMQLRVNAAWITV